MLASAARAVGAGLLVIDRPALQPYAEMVAGRVWRAHVAGATATFHAVV